MVIIHQGGVCRGARGGGWAFPHLLSLLMTCKVYKQLANEVAARPAVGATMDLWREDQPSKITRLGHQAEKSKARDSAGREYCNCHEKNNQKCSFLMAGSRNKCQETNTWKESENVRLKVGDWQMAVLGWNSITITSPLLTLQAVMLLSCERPREVPKTPGRRRALLPVTPSRFPRFSALVVSQCEPGLCLVWSDITGTWI